MPGPDRHDPSEGGGQRLRAGHFERPERGVGERPARLTHHLQHAIRCHVRVVYQESLKREGFCTGKIEGPSKIRSALFEESERIT